MYLHVAYYCTLCLSTFLYFVSCSVFHESGVQDLELIIEEIHELSDVERLGLNLGLYMPAIERIQDQYKSPGQQERRIILYWLQRKDIVPNKQACLPTWEALADAVAKQSTALSHKIRAKYCTPSP